MKGRKNTTGEEKLDMKQQKAVIKREADREKEEYKLHRSTQSNLHRSNLFHMPDSGKHSKGNTEKY